MTANILNARVGAAQNAYTNFDFIDANVEGQFAWQAMGNELHRTVFLAPVEAEDGVEMVAFRVRFAADSAEIEDVYCVTAAGNHYGRLRDANASQYGQNGDASRPVHAAPAA